jgi:thiol-disulfide isomerase/thioredoxin
MATKITKLLGGIFLFSFLGATNAAGVTVYDFFASWCGPCRADIARDNELQKEYEGKVKFIGVNEDVEPNKADAFIASTQPKFDIRRDPSHEFAKSMGADNKTPSIVISSNKRGKELISGSLSQSDLKARINGHLE